MAVGSAAFQPSVTGLPRERIALWTTVATVQVVAREKGAARTRSDVVPTPAQRAVEAAAVLKEDEAVTGWAALAWLGGTWFDGTHDGVRHRPVTVVARRNVRARSGFEVSQEFLHPDEILVVDGLRVTVPVRSVTFEMRYADGPGAAVEAIDMACCSDLVSIAEVTAYVGQLGPVAGIQQARDALVEAEEISWSPRETRMRGTSPGGPGGRRTPRPAPARHTSVDHGTAVLVDADGDSCPTPRPGWLAARTLPPLPPRCLRSPER